MKRKYACKHEKINVFTGIYFCFIWSGMIIRLVCWFIDDWQSYRSAAQSLPSQGMDQ